MEYKKEVKKQLIENLKILRNNINSESLEYKIFSYCKKWDDDPKEVKKEIIKNDRFARFFIKDPKKQNIYEKLFLEYMINKGYNIEKLSSLGKNAIYIENGKLRKGSSNINSTKSMDFVEKRKDETIYYYQKYTEDSCGGAQDNQYKDMIFFIKEALKVKNKKIKFIAVCDGGYYNEIRIDEMKKLCGKNSNVKVMNTNEF